MDKEDNKRTVEAVLIPYITNVNYNNIKMHKARTNQDTKMW
jgi:hypothetical protein